MKSNPYLKHPTSNPALVEETIASKEIFDGKIISLQVDTVKLPNGQTGTREIIKHPGAVAVLALKGDKMLVVDQYRQALGRTQVEIPAGKLDPGEDPMEAAGRELREETGYHAQELKPLPAFYIHPVLRMRLSTCLWQSILKQAICSWMRMNFWK